MAAKKTARCRRVPVITKIFNIPVNDIDAKETPRCRRVLVVTELVVSGTHCTSIVVKLNRIKDLLRRRKKAFIDNCFALGQKSIIRKVYIKIMSGHFSIQFRTYMKHLELLSTDLI